MQVIYVDVDAMRPDHLGCYGYEQDTTPNIDRVAEDGFRFDRAYAANTPCMPSRAALLSGRYGISNGVETHGARGRTMHGPEHWDGWDGDESAYQTLPEACFNEHVRSVGISPFPRHPAKWFYHLWNEFVQPQDAENRAAPDGEVVADEAIRQLPRLLEGECFCYLNFWDPHVPYRRSDEEIERFTDESLLPPYPTAEQIEAHQEWDAWKSASEEGVADRSDLARLLGHYDAEIHYADRQIGRLIDALEAEGAYDDVWIVITADHGEEFGEHGLYVEHWSTHEGTQRVPMVVKPPADVDFDPGTRDQLITNVDIAPTIADYAGIDRPDAWQGRSLRPVVESAAAEWRDAVVVDHGLYTAQRAIRTDRWKLIRTYHPGHWGGVVPERQLFDLPADPWEQDDVSADHPDVVERLEQEMHAWADEHVGREGDPLREVARTEPDGMKFGRDFEGV